MFWEKNSVRFVIVLHAGKHILNYISLYMPSHSKHQLKLHSLSLELNTQDTHFCFNEIISK